MLTTRLEAEGYRPRPFLLEADEAAMRARLEQLIAEEEVPAGVLHLEPPSEVLFSPEARARLKALFLLAKLLHPYLTAVKRGRPLFLVATRMDGAAGFEGGGSPVAGGYAGLTKSLALEWPNVFCRSVDFAPSMQAETIAERLLAEMHDPDLRLREIAWKAEGRFTLEAFASEVNR